MKWHRSWRRHQRSSVSWTQHPHGWSNAAATSLRWSLQTSAMHHSDRWSFLGVTRLLSFDRSWRNALLIPAILAHIDLSLTLLFCLRSLRRSSMPDLPITYADISCSLPSNQPTDRIILLKQLLCHERHDLCCRPRPHWRCRATRLIRRLTPSTTKYSWTF